MTDLNYQSTTLVNADVEHLRILTICWYVWSGLLALGGLFPFIHLTVGILMVVQPGVPHRDPILPFMGAIFITVASLLILIMWASAVLSFITARSMAKRRRRMFCFVCAVLACLNIPLGVLLGVFTLIVLSRQSVQNMFNTSDQVGPA